GTVAKRRMKHGAILRRVDSFAREHCIYARTQATCVCERNEQRERLGRHSLTREVEQEIELAARKRLETLRILREKITQMLSAQTSGVLLESFPFGSVIYGRHSNRESGPRVREGNAFSSDRKYRDLEELDARARRSASVDEPRLAILHVFP